MSHPDHAAEGAVRGGEVESLGEVGSADATRRPSSASSSSRRPLLSVTVEVQHGDPAIHIHAGGQGIPMTASA